MKMYFLKTLVPVALFLACQAHSRSGGMEGAGGNAVICRDSNGKFLSAEVYDLFEGRALYGYKPQIKNLDYRTQARVIARMITETTQDTFFETETERILKDLRFLPSDAALVPIDDSGSIIRPSHCDLFQAAVYLADKRVYFDSTVWSFLTETHRAALISHEVFYAYLRHVDSAITSRRARQYVAYMYSGQSLQKSWIPADGEHFEVCRTDYQNPSNSFATPTLVFYSRLNEDGTWKISFRYFNGLKVLGRTEINSRAPGYGYRWPIASHDLEGGLPGGYGVGLDENLEFDVDEGWSVTNWFLDHDSKNNYVTLKTDGQSRKIYFSCDRVNF